MFYLQGAGTALTCVSWVPAVSMRGLQMQILFSRFRHRLGVKARVLRQLESRGRISRGNMRSSGNTTNNSSAYALTIVAEARRNLVRFFNRNSMRELEPPPFANSDPEAVEILRVWATPRKSQNQISLRTTWIDSGAWGLLLADVAHQAARAYAEEGRDPADVLLRIRELLDAEFVNPTCEPTR